MAKFKPGDKVTWQHHNGSYSNEVVDYIVPPNGYAFKDGGVGAESELRAGWVPESQTGMANMPPLNSRACNGVRSRNAAPSAQLKRAYDEWKRAAEKFKKWFGAGRRLSERIPAGADESRKMVDFSNLFFKETGRRPPNGYGEMTLEQMLASNSQTCVRSRNSVVAKALNACGTALNAMQDAGRYVQECNKFIPEANALIREWDAFYKKMTEKRKWYDSKMTELRDGFYRIDKSDPDYDKARAAYDALRDVSRSAEAVHLFYSV